jgi:hypothetical protein
MYPNGQPELAPTSTTPTTLAKSQTNKASFNKASPADAAAGPAAFPHDWGAIGPNHLVLAKDDGPWGTWWEAIAIEGTDGATGLKHPNRESFTGEHIQCGQEAWLGCNHFLPSRLFRKSCRGGPPCPLKALYQQSLHTARYGCLPSTSTATMWN